MLDFLCKESYDLRDFVALITFLRSPDGCPWDQVQTHESIRRNFLEETYEACEAIDAGDTAHLKEELGDVLFQVVFHAQIEKERGVFEIDDVIDGICKKMIYRHPHVFGNVEVSKTDEILNNWDDLKMTEKHQESVTDTLNSVARTLPSLIRAQKIQKKAAKSGFEWADVKDAIQKVHEELDEVERAMDGDGDISEEIGDLLFATAKVARFAEVDAERALS